MEAENEAGHLSFKLGPIERWVIAVAALALMGLLSYVFHSFDDRLEKQGNTMSTVVTQQAITNVQLVTLNNQLQDMPQIASKIAEMKVQVDRNSSDIHELQQVKRLR